MPTETALTKVIERPPLLFLDTEELLHSLSLFNNKSLGKPPSDLCFIVERTGVIYLECLDPQAILCHLGHSIPQIHLQSPLLIPSSLQGVLYPLQAKAELGDL
jgi:hypothetical protein